MRKVFVFWGIILVVLVAGTAMFLYGRMLLNAETEKSGILLEELARAATVRKHAAGVPVAESYQTPDRMKSPEKSESADNKTGPVPPHRHILPTMPRFYKPAEDVILE